jgi:hypothetical protein
MPRAASPEMAGAESVGLLGASALGARAAGRDSPRRDRGITLADPGPTAGPSGWNGYSPVDSTDITDGRRANPFSDAYGYSDAEAPGPHDSWPLNPAADSGLGSPPGTSAGPSRTVAGPSGTNAGPSGTVAGPSNLPRLSTGPTHIGGVGAGVGASPQMKELRKAWGWEQ